MSRPDPLTLLEQTKPVAVVGWDDLARGLELARGWIEDEAPKLAPLPREWSVAMVDVDPEADQLTLGVYGLRRSQVRALRRYLSKRL